MTDTEHLQLIKAECERLLAIAEKRTQGERASKEIDGEAWLCCVEMNAWFRAKVKPYQSVCKVLMRFRLLNAAFRTLKDDEIPIVGDQAWSEAVKKWETVTIPSMWLAGGSRIAGTIFRRNAEVSHGDGSATPTHEKP
jgi:hypothetical protein